MSSLPDGETSTADLAPEIRPSRGQRPGPCLYRILDCSDLTAGSDAYPLVGVDELTLGRGVVGSAVRDGKRLDLLLSDPQASRHHARLVRDGGGWLVEDLGAKNGTFVDGERITRGRLGDGATLEVGHTFFLFRERVPPAPEGTPINGLRSHQAALRAGFADLVRVARSDTRVMLLGETGVGKDLVAHAYHRLSGRAGELIAVNCGALPPTLVEATLFGHRKGAFSGAIGESTGMLRAADGGTLFLDELGDLPGPAQATLLRTLETGEVVPVGGAQPMHVDLRVVSATNRDMPALIARGDFRADLWARLSGFVLRIPPLRERLEDLGACVAQTLARIAPARAPHLTLTLAAARELVSRRWALNVRELVNVLHRALALTDDVIGLEHLPPAAVLGAPATATAAPAREARASARRARLEILLEAHDGNVSEVARILGKARPLVHRWMKELGIEPEQFRAGPGW